MAMLSTQALRTAHVRTAQDMGDPKHSRRACPCCITLVPRSRDTVKMRRAQRRRENHAFRTAREF